MPFSVGGPGSIRSPAAEGGTMPACGVARGPWRCGGGLLGVGLRSRTNAVQLGRGLGRQGVLVSMLMLMVALQVVRSMAGPRALYFGIARLTMRPLIRTRRVGSRWART